MAVGRTGGLTPPPSGFRVRACSPAGHRPSSRERSTVSKYSDWKGALGDAEGMLADEVEVDSLASARDAIATSLASAQRSLAESHERALRLLARCVEKAKPEGPSPCRSATSRTSGIQVTPTGSLKVAPNPEGQNPAGFQGDLGRRPSKLCSWVSNSSSVVSDSILLTDGGAKKQGQRQECRPSQQVTRSCPMPGVLQDVPPKASRRQQRAGDDSSSLSSSSSSSASEHEEASSPSCRTSRVSQMRISPVPVPPGAPSELEEPALRGMKSNSEKQRMRRVSVASIQSLDATQVFELLPLWKRWTSTTKSKKKVANIRKLTRDMSNEVTRENDESEAKRWWEAAPIHPSSWARAVWDVISFVMVLYDMVVIPLLFFDIEEANIILAMKWMTRLFWTFDIAVSFLTGSRRHDGTVERNMAVIARRYLRTFFIMDIAIVGLDWFEVALDDYSTRAGAASLSFRILRLVRLLRLARVVSVLSVLTERIESEQMVVVVGIVEIMLLIVGMGHVIACLWYGLATMDRQDTWLRVHQFQDAPLDYKYTTSLHWALLQFAGGTDEIVAQNTWERTYSIVVFLSAFVVASVFVGRLTSSMTKLHMLASKDMEKLQALRRYLQKHGISSRLARRVQHNAHHALFERHRFMEESKVELLDMISEPLRVELHFELYSPVLAVHPFFRAYIEACPQVIRRLCHAAMSQLIVSAGDVVFMLGEVPVQPRMLIVCSGRLTYHYATGAVVHVEVGQWISEAALWTSWTYRGMLTAASDCRLCVLSAAKFWELADSFDHPDFDLKRYAQAFVETLNSGMMECSDLPYRKDCTSLLKAIEGMSCHLDTAKHWNVTNLEEIPVEEEGSTWLSRFLKRASLISSDSREQDVSVVPGYGRSVFMQPA